MRNEHGIFFPIDNQCPNRTNPNQSSMEVDGVEIPIFHMDNSTSEKGQSISAGCGIGNVSSSQGDNLLPEKTLMNNVCFDYGKNIKFNPDEMLDDIVLSDEDKNEMDDLDEKKYNEESKKIIDFYEEDETVSKYTGTKNEVEELKEIPVPFEISPSDIFEEAGTIYEMFEDKILLKVNTSNGILDLDNIVFNTNKIPIGYLDDVIGNVESPYYVLKIFPNLKNKTNGLGLAKNQQILYVKTKSKTIMKDKILNKKGCDASNAFDEEISEDELEFSDDEEELKVKAKRKQIKKQMKPSNNEEIYTSNKKHKYDDNKFLMNIAQTLKSKHTDQANKPKYAPEYKLEDNNEAFPTNPFTGNNMGSFPPNNLNQNFNQQNTNAVYNMFMMQNQFLLNSMMNNMSTINPFAHPSMNNNSNSNQ